MTKGRLFWRQTSGIGPPALRPPLDVAGAEFDLADLDRERPFYRLELVEDPGGDLRLLAGQEVDLVDEAALPPDPDPEASGEDEEDVLLGLVPVLGAEGAGLDAQVVDREERRLDQVGRLAPDLSFFHLRTPSWWPQLMQRAASLNPFFLMKHGARFRNISVPHFGQRVAWSVRPRDRAASSLDSRGCGFGCGGSAPPAAAAAGAYSGCGNGSSRLGGSCRTPGGRSARRAGSRPA